MWNGAVWYINCDQGGDDLRQRSWKELDFSKAGRMKSAMKWSKGVAKCVDLDDF